MLGGNRLLQGLAFGIVGCAIVPLTKSSFFTGGGDKTPSNIPSSTQVTAQEGPKVTTPKRDTFVKLLLAGTKAEDGLVAELSREDKEDSQWKIGKVTWKGENWNQNWTLYSDDADGEYTFTDKTWYEFQRGCRAQARSWKNNKVCATRGKVMPNDQGKWKSIFPKIELKTGWKTYFREQGYSASVFLDSLSNCSVKITENSAGRNKWTVTITCDDGRLVKTLSDSDFSTMTIEKH